VPMNRVADASEPDAVSRFRRVVTAAIWPLTIVVPLAPLFAALSLRARGVDGADDLVTQTALLAAAFVLGMLAVRALLQLQWARQGDDGGARVLSTAQSWMLVLVTTSAAWFAFGIATIGGSEPQLTARALVYGLFGMVVPLIVVGVLAVRPRGGRTGGADHGGRERLPEGDL